MFTGKQKFVFTVLVAVVTIVIFLVVPCVIIRNSLKWGYGPNTGFIGDTIGGTVGPVVGFLGVILTFLAFYIQYQANQIQIASIKEQSDSAIKNDRANYVQQTQNTFFELLKLHRENVKGMHYRGDDSTKVLVVILDQFYKLYDYISSPKATWSRRVSERDKASIAYLIMFFGAGSSSLQLLSNILLRQYKDLHAEIMDSVSELALVKYNRPDGKTAIAFSGHQSRLGHYFRHMFMIVKFIHEDEVLNDDEKRKYIKFLRTQLSTQEQILFFFNSLSELGKSWELSPDILPENKLVTRYHLIKNVPVASMRGFNPKSYYPNLELEYEF